MEIGLIEVIFEGDSAMVIQSISQGTISSIQTDLMGSFGLNLLLLKLKTETENIVVK